MNRVVFDTSVAIKWFFPEKGKTEALKLKDRHLEGKISLCTRDLFLYEFASAFKNYSTVKIEEKDFSLASQAIQSLKIKLASLEFEELGELFSLSRELNISVYDCAYLLLARSLKAPFYTADKKLYNKAKDLVSAFFI